MGVVHLICLSDPKFKYSIFRVVIYTQMLRKTQVVDLYNIVIAPVSLASLANGLWILPDPLLSK